MKKLINTRSFEWFPGGEAARVEPYERPAKDAARKHPIAGRAPRFEK
jgi:hypothetical protein